MSSIITLILSYKYLIVFPLAIVEGPFLAVLLGYLIHGGYLNVYITFILLLIADIGPDIFYYRLGRYGNKKLLENKYFSNSEKANNNLKVLEHMWLNHTKKTMFFGKLAYGIAVPIIISAGVAKLPFKKFILTSLPVGIFEVGLLLFIGYHIGTSYEVAIQYIKYPVIILALLLVAVLILYILFSKYFTKLFNIEIKK